MYFQRSFRGCCEDGSKFRQATRSHAQWRDDGGNERLPLGSAAISNSHTHRQPAECDPTMQNEDPVNDDCAGQGVWCVRGGEGGSSQWPLVNYCSKGCVPFGGPSCHVWRTEICHFSTHGTIISQQPKEPNCHPSHPRCALKHASARVIHCDPTTHEQKGGNPPSRPGAAGVGSAAAAMG